jgi:hypothetical protein
MRGMRIDVMSMVGGALVGFGVGGFAGYQYARIVLEQRLAARLDDEVAAVKAYYSKRAAEARADFVASQGDHGVQWTPAVADQSGIVVDSLRITDDIPTAADPDGVESPGGDDADGLAGGEQLDVGDDNAGPPALEKSGDVNITPRDTSKPYAISAQEFGESEPGTQQLTITYYAGDKVLTDDKDLPIRDVIKTVGPLSALSFGGISEDPHVRYVRNEELEIDFEIILSAQSYAEAVLNYGNPSGKGT